MTVPPDPSARPRPRLRALCRVIVDNDFAGDPDGLAALAHHLVSPSNRVVLITSSFLNQSLPGPRPTAADGAALAAELVDVVGGVSPVVVAGSERGFDLAGPTANPAADAIVAEARRDDPVPPARRARRPRLTEAMEALPLLRSRRRG